MRLYKYLNEELNTETLDELISYLQKNCDKFLNTLEKLRGANIIYSGRNGNYDYIIKNVRKERKPKDTPEAVHNLLNQYFKEHTGIRLRSESLFVVTDTLNAQEYGNPYAIFPIGKYQLGYNPEVDDLYHTLSEIVMEITDGRLDLDDLFRNYSIKQGEGKKIGDEFKEKAEIIVKNYIRGFPTKRSSKEGMLHCDSYVGIKVEHVAQVLDALGLRNSVDI